MVLSLVKLIPPRGNKVSPAVLVLARVEID